MNKNNKNHGATTLEFSLLLPIFIVLILFYLQLLILLWSGLSSQWFLWRGLRLEATQYLDPQTLINTLTTNQQGQSLLLTSTFLNQTNLQIHYWAMINQQMVLEDPYTSAAVNQSLCQSNQSPCLQFVSVEICETSPSGCIPYSGLINLGPLIPSLVLPFAHFGALRPLEAAGGYF